MDDFFKSEHFWVGNYTAYCYEARLTCHLKAVKTKKWVAAIAPTENGENIYTFFSMKQGRKSENLAKGNGGKALVGIFSETYKLWSLKGIECSTIGGQIKQRPDSAFEMPVVQSALNSSNLDGCSQKIYSATKHRSSEIIEEEREKWSHFGGSIVVAIKSSLLVAAIVARIVICLFTCLTKNYRFVNELNTFHGLLHYKWKCLLTPLLFHDGSFFAASRCRQSERGSIRFDRFYGECIQQWNA